MYEFKMNNVIGINEIDSDFIFFDAVDFLKLQRTKGQPEFSVLFQFALTYMDINTCMYVQVRIYVRIYGGKYQIVNVLKRESCTKGPSPHRLRFSSLL